MEEDVYKIFDSLPFISFESEGSFGRHYRFANTHYKVIVYVLHSDVKPNYRLSYHKELEWSRKNNQSYPLSAPEPHIKDSSRYDVAVGWFNSSFEEIFESVDDDLREQLSWHFDIFQK